MGRTKAVLIIGGSGFIGTHLALRLRETHKIFATYYRHPVKIPGVTFIPLGVENSNWAKRIAYTAQPDVVVYAAGSNDAAWAEKNDRDTQVTHTAGPATIALAADILQPKFIYLSSCYTFDGVHGNYRETDTALPSGALGKAKLAGENFIRGRSLNYLILRSSPLYGRGNAFNLSFFDHLRMALDRGVRFGLPSHEGHSFAPVEGFVELIARLIDSGVRNRIVHYGGLTKLSHYAFAYEFAKRFGYDPNLLIAKRHERQKEGVEDFSEDYSLNCSQAVELLKVKPLLMEEGFDLIEKNLVRGL